MARFAVNQPIDTLEPAIAVDPTLAIGLHRFQLVVTDASGNRSQPALATVEVTRATPGGGVLDPVRDPARDPVVVNPLGGGILAPPAAPQPSSPPAATPVPVAQAGAAAVKPATRTKPAKQATPASPSNRKTRKPK